MKTIKIRDVRGPLLDELAQQRQLVGITSNRVLVAVLVPVTRAWVEGLVEANFSRIEQNVLAGERELGSGRATSLDDVLRADVPAGPQSVASSSSNDPLGALTALPGVSSVAGMAVRGLSSVRSAMGLFPDSEHDGPPPMEAVRIGDLSGSRIELAGQAGQTLALTNGRVLVGVLVPVTQQLVEHLVDQNLSRIMYNIAQGELEATSGESMVTLDDVLTEKPAEPVNPADKLELPARGR